MEILEIKIQFSEALFMLWDLPESPTEQRPEGNVHMLPFLKSFLCLLPLPVQAGVNVLRQILPLLERV